MPRRRPACTRGPRRVRTAIPLLAALLLALIHAGPALAQSGQISVTGDVSVHDPTLYKDGDTYIAGATGGSIRSAPSLGGPWTDLGDVPKADWTFEISPGALWAPHVQRIGDTFYYYYSQSSFGSQTSAIGLKTTQTPTDPSSYVDHGEPIIASGAASGSEDPFDHNAIDPNLHRDLNGDWWISWGSHWDGIMIQRLEDDMVTVSGEMTQIASRGSDRFPVQPGFAVPPNRVEGPAIFERNGYYYLLTGWDWCCRGDDSTYKISIGRSQSIDGPYVDKNGVPLTEGGGSTILNTRFARPGVTPGGLWRGPGGPDVFVEGGTHYLIYHAYRPGSTLGIRPMDWHDGWPYFQEPGGGAYDLSDGSHYRLVNEAGPSSDPDSVHNPVASDRCLTAAGDSNVIQASCGDSPAQVWRLERELDGFYRFRSMVQPRDRCLTMSNASGEVGTNVVVAPCQAAQDLQAWYLDDAGPGFHRLVVKRANLALEVLNVDGTLETNVVGGFRRDGENRATHPETGVSCASGPAVCADANQWPPQQWQLVPTEPGDDVTAPETSAGLDPPAPDGEQGWYRSPVTVRFEARDDEGGSGVARTEYRIDSGDEQDWEEYNALAPPVISGDGEHLVEYRSVDVAGNVEDAKSAGFRTDATPPITSASVDPSEPPGGPYEGPVTLRLTASDATSGVAMTEYRIDDGVWVPYNLLDPPVVSALGAHEVSFRSTDVAGNVEEGGQIAFTIVGEPRLRVRGRPQHRRVGVDTRQVGFRLEAANVGTAPTGPVRLCARAPRRRVAIKGERCITRGEIAIGATARHRVKLRIKAAARGKLTTITLLARGPDTPSQRAVVRLRVGR